jgi:hypothetical protein
VLKRLAENNAGWPLLNLLVDIANRVLMTIRDFGTVAHLEPLRVPESEADRWLRTLRVQVSEDGTDDSAESSTGRRPFIRDDWTHSSSGRHHPTAQPRGRRSGTRRHDSMPAWREHIVWPHRVLRVESQCATPAPWGAGVLIERDGRIWCSFPAITSPSTSARTNLFLRQTRSNRDIRGA